MTPKTEQFPTGARWDDGRRYWDERYGDAYAQAKNWRKLAVFSMVAAVLLGAGYITEARRDKVQTVFVAVNEFGQTVSSGLVDASNTKVSPAAVKMALTQWIKNVRNVSRDTTMQKAAMDEVYRPLTVPAKKFVEEFYFGNQQAGIPPANPFDRMRSEIVGVTTVDYMQLTANTAQITWTEVVRSLAGDTKETKKMQANITFDVIAPATPAEAARNPLGIQIQGVAWTELQQH